MTVTHECIKCGVVFWLSDQYDAERHKDKASFYCPNGHPQCYRESDADKLRRELQRAQQQIARAEDETREARDEAAAQVKLRKRLEKRVHNGVCPCCSRSFANLRRHMATKHPNVTPIKAAS